MKKTLLASLIASVSFSASADMLIGGDVEVNAWRQSQTLTLNSSELDGGDNTDVTFEASLEHFIPLVPNVKFGQSAVDGDYLAYTKRDVTLYYEFLDNDLVSVDAGVGISEFSDGEVWGYNGDGLNLDEFKGYLPHLYVAAEVGIPGTPLFFFVKGNGIAYSDSNLVDFSIGAQFEIPMGAFDVELQAGYREQSLDFDDFDDVDIDASTDGFFAGVNLDF